MSTAPATDADSTGKPLPDLAPGECPPECDYHDERACPEGQICHPHFKHCMSICIDCAYPCTKGENLCPPCPVEDG